MKIYFFALMSICNISLQAQDITSRIMKCIGENFALADTDFLKSLGIIEHDLINRKIIDTSRSSIYNQYLSVAAIGRIKQSRTVEHILLEQIGIPTMKHCTNLVTYSAAKEDTPELFEFFREIDELQKKNQINPDFNQMKYKKQIAHTILNYYENIREDAPIWKAIHLLYLYKLTEMEEDLMLPSLVPFEHSTNTVELMINSNGLLELMGKPIEDGEIFLAMKPLIKNKFTLNVNCHESTSFYKYYEIINTLYHCIDLLRDEQAIELYKKNYEDLTTPEFKHIHELIPGYIIENPPN